MRLHEFTLGESEYHAGHRVTVDLDRVCVVVARDDKGETMILLEGGIQVNVACIYDTVVRLWKGPK